MLTIVLAIRQALRKNKNLRKKELQFSLQGLGTKYAWAWLLVSGVILSSASLMSQMQFEQKIFPLINAGFLFLLVMIEYGKKVFVSPDIKVTSQQRRSWPLYFLIVIVSIVSLLTTFIGTIHKYYY